MASAGVIQTSICSLSFFTIIKCVIFIIIVFNIKMYEASSREATSSFHVSSLLDGNQLSASTQFFFFMNTPLMEGFLCVGKPFVIHNSCLSS